MYQHTNNKDFAKHVDLVETNHGLGLKDIVGLLIGIKGGDTASLFQMYMSVAGTNNKEQLIEHSQRMIFHILQLQCMVLQ